MSSIFDFWEFFFFGELLSFHGGFFLGVKVPGSHSYDKRGSFAARKDIFVTQYIDIQFFSRFGFNIRCVFVHLPLF